MKKEGFTTTQECQNASRNTAARILAQCFPEFEGLDKISQGGYITKEDKRPRAYTLDQIRAQAAAVRKHKKRIPGEQAEEIYERLKKCNE